MDGRAAIAFNHQALKRIVAGLVAMAGLTGQSPPLRGFEARSSDRAGGSIVGREGRDAAEGSGDPAGLGESPPLRGRCPAGQRGVGAELTPGVDVAPLDLRVGVPAAPQPPPDAARRPPHATGEVTKPALTLPRHLRLAILRLLRPAESAARRLIIAAARGLSVTLPPPRKPRPKPVLADPMLRRFGIAVVLSPADPAAGAFAARAAKKARPHPEGSQNGQDLRLAPKPEASPCRSSIRRDAACRRVRAAATCPPTPCRASASPAARIPRCAPQASREGARRPDRRHAPGPPPRRPCRRPRRPARTGDALRPPPGHSAARRCCPAGYAGTWPPKANLAAAARPTARRPPAHLRPRRPRPKEHPRRRRNSGAHPFARPLRPGASRHVMTATTATHRHRPPLRHASRATSPPLDGGEERRRTSAPSPHAAQGHAPRVSPVQPAHGRRPSSPLRSGGEVARPQGETEWGLRGHLPRAMLDHRPTGRCRGQRGPAMNTWPGEGWSFEDSAHTLSGDRRPRWTTLPARRIFRRRKPGVAR